MTGYGGIILGDEQKRRKITEEILASGTGDV